MLNIDAEFNLADDGVWAEFSGSRFKVLHISNLKFQRTLSRLQQPHRRKIEAGTIDPSLSKDILCKAVSEALIVDWDKVTDKSGDFVPYSHELCYKLLQKNPEFREFIAEFSNNIDNFRSMEIEELGKN